MGFQKISAPSLKELFTKELENMILAGELQIGEKLPPERDLAKTMQVSRAVVNAGIVELQRKGFLQIRPRIGTFVADYRRNGTMETLIAIMNYNGGILRDAEIKSILELRIALDTLILQLTIPKITSEEIQHLKELTSKMKDCSSLKEASELAYLFQHELAFLSGNTLVPLIFYSFKAPISSLWERFCRLYGIHALYNNNQKLCSYIEAKDLDGAVSWLNSSIQDTISGSKQIYY